MINFKLVDKVDDMVTGPVLSTALAGGTTEDHRVTFEKALDLEPFLYTKPIRKLVTGQTVTIDIPMNIATTEGTAAVTALLDCLLIGPLDTHLKFDVANDSFVLFDPISNTLFTDYSIDSDDISVVKIGAKAVEDKVIMYKLNDGTIGFCNFIATYTNFSLAYSGNTLTITLDHDGSEAGNGGAVFPDSSALDISLNPLTKPEIIVVGKDFYKQWKLQANKVASLGKSLLISNVSYIGERQGTVSNEKIKMLTHNIIRTEQKGLDLVDGSYTVNTRTFDGNGFIYIYDENNNVVTVNVLDVDVEKGLILLEDSLLGYSKLRIDYTVSTDTWYECSSVNFNPLFERLSNGLDPIENNYYDQIELWYSSQGSGLFFSINNASTTKYEFCTGNESYFTNFIKMGILKLNIKEPSFLDARKPGGKLININHTDEYGPVYDIRSHMSFGFMGESPEQSNILVVGLGINVLTPILLKFDTVAQTTFETTYGYTIDSGSATNAEIIEYITDYIHITIEENILLDDLRATVERYTPLGVIYIAKIGDSSDIIFSNTDSSSFETKIAGEYA